MAWGEGDTGGWESGNVMGGGSGCGVIMGTGAGEWGLGVIVGQG